MRKLNVLLLGLACLLPQLAAAVCPTNALPRVTVKADQDGDGFAVTGEEMQIALASAPNEPITKVEIVVDQEVVLTVDATSQPPLPPPNPGDGTTEIKLHYVVGNSKPGAVRLPKKQRPQIHARATTARGCGQSADTALITRDPATYAVVVGINQYPKVDSSLKFARRDAEAVALHLLDNFEGMEKSNIRLLTDDPLPGETTRWTGTRRRATRDEILHALGELSEKVDTAGTFIFYFSGHGYANVNGTNAFVVPEEAALREAHKMVKIDDVVDYFENANAERSILILDACFSTEISVPDGLDYRPGRAFGPVRKPDAIKRFIDNRNVIVVASSDKLELSYELGGTFNHGALTYFLLHEDPLAPPPAGAPRDNTILGVFKMAKVAVTREVKKAFNGAIQQPRQWDFGDAHDIVWIRPRSQPQPRPPGQ